MTPPKSFGLNRYNWFGQKLLAQNRFEDLIHLKNNLAPRSTSSDLTDETFNNLEVPMSDHLTFITGLAVMKTSTRLDELIYSLQRLNFQKNGHYFLLLCQCLLYSGNHDAVVALCKQTLDKEIFSPTHVQPVKPKFKADVGHIMDQIASGNADGKKQSIDQAEEGPQKSIWSLQETHDETDEFQTMFMSIASNDIINDPRLWFTFGLSLEFQRQFGEADPVYRVACKLASGQAGKMASWSEGNLSDILIGSSREIRQRSQDNFVGISNYYTPHKIYSEFCVRYQGDYRTSIDILDKAAQISPPINYTLNPTLALTLCSQANSNASSSLRAIEMMNSLDNHAVSLRNPSFVYNQLALKCKQKLVDQCTTARRIDSFSFSDRTHDERRFGLDYALIKSHIINNEIVRNSPDLPNMYKYPANTAHSSGNNQAQLQQVFAQIDNALETLKGCNSACWASYALWNNLGVFYLLKRRYIASLSCLRNASRINPTDWRINYNLSLVYLHFSLPLRSLCCSLAANNFRQLASTFSDRNTCLSSSQTVPDPLTGTTIAISYSELNLVDEARRFYTEIVAVSRNKGSSRAPLLALTNYLLLLHENASNIEDESDKGRDSKAISSVLDLIEQAWLQRSPNESQFASSILELVNQIAQFHQFAS